MSDADFVRYRVVHETHYDYATSVASARHLAHLTPRRTAWQRVTSHHLEIAPEPTELFANDDFFGNHQTQFALERDHDSLTVRADSVVEITRRTHSAEALQVPWESALCESVVADFWVLPFCPVSPGLASECLAWPD